MKRFLSCVLALLTLFALAAPAFADVIWEPMDNSFYYKHWKQCEYENRAYYANGQEGFVTFWDAPDGTMVRAQYENGEKLWVYYIYDSSWALIEIWNRETHTETSAWAPLSDLVLVYDSLSFDEEYADRIKPYNGEFADYGGEIEAVNFYDYPGAPSIDASIKAENLLDNLTGTADQSSAISKIFVDEDGRTWGYIGYLYGVRNVWFCLDEPDGENFPVRAVPDPGLSPARTPSLPAAGYTPYVLVAVVVAATGGLLAVFYGKKRKKK